MEETFYSFVERDVKKSGLVVNLGYFGTPDRLWGAGLTLVADKKPR